ncbi:sodium:proton antiporter [Serinibacter arcticus]|uniref:Sodium:proton antiporter n=1 Tax=Serinibacter arcticus TaxID=1655435 RepID=A0A2U1ZZK3_9MICO|nr:sodium:proton antiporter [Serinibacter arcticus]
MAHGRDESGAERADRNWSELLQELRVMQTGVQVLTGFLLTLPFQQRFAELDRYQLTLYLALVCLSVATTGVLIAPVAVHRSVFRRGLKAPLVTASDRLTRLGLVMLGLVVTGTAMLAFDVVLSRTAGIVVGACAATLLAVLWVLVPQRLGAAARDAARDRARTVAHVSP